MGKGEEMKTIQEKPKKRINLEKQYREEITSWDWEGLKKDLEKAEYVNENDGNPYSSLYIGTVFEIMPSGKYWMFWTTNQSYFDMIRDSLYREIMEEIAEENNMWIENGEGDPCDLFICMCID